MRGVRFVPPCSKWNKGKFKHWQGRWLAQHEANGQRLKYYFETQTSAVLQRLQWEHERTQLKRGPRVLDSCVQETLRRLYVST